MKFSVFNSLCMDTSFIQFVGISFFFYAQHLQSRYQEGIEVERLIAKCITWTIEWPVLSTDVLLLDHGINENSTLSFVSEKHLKPGPWNHKLKPLCAEQLDCVKFFILKYPKVPIPVNQRWRSLLRSINQDVQILVEFSQWRS